MPMEHQFINSGEAAFLQGRPGVIYEERDGQQRQYRWRLGAMQLLGDGGTANSDWVPTEGGATIDGVVGKVYDCTAPRQIKLLNTGAEDDFISAAWNAGAGDVEFVADVANGASIVPSGIKKISGKASQFMTAVRTSTPGEWRVIGADPTVGVNIDVVQAADWPALQAAFPNDGAALLALPKGASAWVDEFVAGTGIGGRVYRSKAGTHWTAPHPITLFLSAVASGRDVMYLVAGAAAPSAVASASGGTKTRVTIVGHGLTAANDGVSVPVTGGANWTPGLYPATYVDANTIDLSVAWNAAFGNPTITVANGASQVTTIHSPGSIPAAMRRSNSETRIESQWQCTNNASTKLFYIRQDANDIASGNITGQGGASDLRIIRQRGSLTSSIAQSASAGSAYSGSTPISLGADAGVARAINFGADLRTGNEFWRIAGYKVTVEIGP